MSLENILELLRSGDLVADVAKLKTDIAEIKQWKNGDAIPKINSNINNIVSIHADINDRILPDIEAAATKVDQAVNTAISASQDAATAYQAAQDVSEGVENALAEAQSAKEDALTASQQAYSAGNKAVQASDIANIAATIAQNASQGANEAMVAAQQSGEQAVNAGNKAQNALEQAVIASQNAINASDIANVASNTAQNAAQAAQSAVDQAQEAANMSVNASNLATNAVDKATNAVAEATMASQTALDASGISQAASQLSQQAQQEAEAALGQAQEAVNTAVSNGQGITAIYNDIRDRIEPLILQASGAAENALGQAQEAMSQAGSFVNTLQAAGNQLVIDSNTIKSGADNLISVITVEMNKIVQAFVLFGGQLKGGADQLKNETVDLGQALLTSINQINVPLGAVEWHINELTKPEIAVWLHLVVGNVFHALAYLIFAGYGGQGSVFGEVIQAFTRIRNEFMDLGGAFLDFGNILKNAPVQLVNTINGSMNSMKTAVATFMNSFGALGDNLAATLMGAGI